jgi:uncharacterized membrane protein (UPF0182 family)
VLSILISGIYPAIVQQVSVKPNASDKEAPYILRNIKATRQAYGIVSASDGGKVGYPTYPVVDNPSKTEVTTQNTTVDNIRLTDPNIVSPTITNKQKIRQVYAFPDKLNVDRYTIDGVEHDYIVSAREADPANLQTSQRNWINEHTVYTHGYGFVAAEADTDITQNEATYAAGDIPPNPPSGPLTPRVPQIYYGQLMSDYSIIGARDKQREFDGTGDQRVTYHGSGGVSLSNPFTKLAFALKYKETNFLLNDAVGAPGARMVFIRDPKARVEKVAPFLTVDGDPYPVVDSASGHIVWMVDAYTTIANYPYSERQSLSDLTHTSLRQGQKDRQINYIRNSVKATVDAYNGTVTLYAWDPSDPVLTAWSHVFPGLIKPAGEMPDSIRSHVRYPQDLFDVQRALLAQYHVNDPVAFYNGSDRWAVPPDPFEPTLGDQPPYYVLANAPGQQGRTAEFQLTSPMLVNNSNNLAAYISADSDAGPNYGHLTVLKVSDKGAVQGPGQVANTFRTNSPIAANIKLLSGTGTESSVIHGNLLTLPLGDSFLYVEPLYAASTYPTLQRVLVSYGNNLGFGATLDDALSDFKPGNWLGKTLGISPGGGSTSNTSQPPSSSTSSPAPPSGTGSSSSAPPTTTLNGLLDQLATARDELNAAYDTHDASQIARAQAKVDDLVNQILDRSTSSSKPSPGPS